MTDSSTSAALVVLALLAQGCVAGHLLDAGRRREHVLAFREALLDGDRLVVAYTAAVTDDGGAPRGERERWAAIALADLARREPIETLRVEHLDGAGPARRDGRSLRILRPEDADSRAPAIPSARVELEDGRPVALLVRAGGGEEAWAHLPSGALARASTAPWVYPVLPLALALDAVADPVLLFFAPAVMLMGD